MVVEMPWTALAGVELRVDAHPGLVLQVLGAVVTQTHGELAGHQFTRVRQEAPGRAVVRFDIRLLGRSFETTEEVTLDERGVSFAQLSGYLPAVEERIECSPSGDGARLEYSGRVRARPGKLGRTLGLTFARLVYRREAKRTLAALKATAEGRQAKSVLFRRAG